MLKRLFAAAAVACLLSGCQSADTTKWGALALAVGNVVGETRIDPEIQRVSAKLAAYCTQVQTAALAVDAFAPAKLQNAASAGREAIALYCAAPPRNVGEAVVSLAGLAARLQAARAGR